MSPVIKKPVMWTLEAALPIIRELEPKLRAADYHLMLGGGVLHRGTSTKDLDLFISPLNTSDSDPKKIVALLDSFWGVEGESLKAHADDYDEDDMRHWPCMLKYVFDGKRIDVFVQ